MVNLYRYYFHFIERITRSKNECDSFKHGKKILNEYFLVLDHNIDNLLNQKVNFFL